MIGIVHGNEKSIGSIGLRKLAKLRVRFCDCLNFTKKLVNNKLLAVETDATPCSNHPLSYINHGNLMQPET
jgi:hypothetical protein